MKKPQNNHDVTEFASELHWLAFCYVAGELTAEQTIQFEQRIAEDLEAQVAVADAVSLSSLSYASIETLQDRKTSFDRRQAVASGRSSLWCWVAVTAAGFFVIVSAWQLLPNSMRSVGNHDVAVKSTDPNGQVANSAIGNNELDLWDRTVEMYQSANLHGDESETWSRNAADESLDGDYGDSEEIADVLLLDSDLTSIFASALSTLDPLKGEM